MALLDSKEMKRHFALLALMLCILLLSGCGKVAKEAAEALAKKADDINLSKAVDDIDTPSSSVTKVDGDSSWVSTYLSHKIPATAIRALIDREKPEYDFRLHPYKALLTGTVTTEEGEIPTQIGISFKKKCAWLMSIDMTLFLGGSGNLIRVDSMIQVDELLDASKADERYYSEIALVPTYDSDKGNIVDQSIEKYLVTKTSRGFEIKFQEPEEKTLYSTESAMLMVESEQHKLEMLRQGVYSYTQNLVDSDAEKLYTKDHVKTVPHLKSSSGIRLWEQTTESSEWINGEWTASSGGRELINSHGVPVYISFKVEGMEFEFWLQEVSFPSVEQCNAGVSSA